MEEDKEKKLQFPDYDPDVMATSDANAIISHYEEIYPELSKFMIENDILFSYLYRHVDNYMEYIEEFKKQGFRLQTAREFAFNVTIDSIKNEAIVIDKEVETNKNTLPSIFFDLDVNPQIDSDTL